MPREERLGGYEAARGAWHAWQDSDRPDRALLDLWGLCRQHSPKEQWYSAKICEAWLEARIGELKAEEDQSWIVGDPTPVWSDDQALRAVVAEPEKIWLTAHDG